MDTKQTQLTPDIWDFQRNMTSRLLNINILNFWLGRRLAQRGDFLRGIGTQAVGWAIINMGIAIWGSTQSRNRLDTVSKPGDEAIQHQETKNLRRILAINTPLNLLYILGGFFLARRNNADTFTRGNGWGIVLQGFILLCFDAIHLRRINQIWQSLRLP